MNRPSHPDRRRRPGFTLVELLVVITILGILVALLVPVIAGAVRTANEARVTGEINNMAQALASFKNKYGDYPPSRVILREDGAYDVTSGTALSAVGWFNTVNDPFNPIGGETPYVPPAAATPDMNYGQLAQRSMRYLRKFWPRALFSTTGQSIPGTAPYGQFHDFNGNGVLDQATGGAAIPILLQGHECLVFFLGGLPAIENNSQLTGLTGFSNDPRWPFVTEYHNGVPAATNRLRPLFEFQNDRLIDDDHDGMPGYIDSLGSQTTGRFFAYFNSYGGGGYDPNDVNFTASTDVDLATRARPFRVNFTTSLLNSPLPNPYTSSLPVPTSGSPASFINAETYQILSPGVDRNYGNGGQYLPSSTGDRLPADAAIQDLGLRVPERDNLTNFATSRLD